MMSVKKRIVILGPAYPLRGGLASFNERLATQFINEGHNVEIFTFSLQYPSFLFPGTTQYSSDPAPQHLHIKVCINSINPFNWIKVGLQLKKLKPDIILVRYWLPFMGPCLGSILRIAKSNKHSRIICLADNIIPHEKRFGDLAFTKYFIKPIDAFITMSQKVKADLLSMCKVPVQVTSHPLYDNFGEKINKIEARQYLNINKSPTYFVFFGFIRKYKGLDLLFEAIAILKKQAILNEHQIQFLIAGEFYDDSKPYLDLIKKLGIEDWLQLKTNFIPDSEVKYYLSAADCIIQPYKSATQSGVTPLAYHFEKPMIVTNVGALPELVPSSVGIIAEANPESIAEAIVHFMKQDVSSFEQAIALEKLKYSWDKMTKLILEQ